MATTADNIRTLSTLGTEESYSPLSSPARSMRLTSATPALGGTGDLCNQVIMEPITMQTQVRKVERQVSVPTLPSSSGSPTNLTLPYLGGAQVRTQRIEPVTHQSGLNPRRSLPASPIKAEPVVRYLGTTIGRGNYSPLGGSMTPPPPFLAASASVPGLGAVGKSSIPSRMSIGSPGKAFPFLLNPDADPLMAFAAQVSANVVAPSDPLESSARVLTIPVSPQPPSGHMAARELFPTTEFKFYKDYTLDGRLPMDASVSSAGLAPPLASEALQVAEMHEHRVDELSRQPPTAANIETQIQELLEGQEAIRNELDQVKVQANNNYNELEQLRHQTLSASAANAYPQQSSTSPLGPALPPPPAHTLPQRSLAPMAPQSPPVATQIRSSTVGPAPDSDNNVLRNLGYHVNHDHFTSLHETLSTHGSSAFATAHGHASNAVNFVSEKAKSKPEGKVLGCV